MSQKQLHIILAISLTFNIFCILLLTIIGINMFYFPGVASPKQTADLVNPANPDLYTLSPTTTQIDMNSLIWYESPRYSYKFKYPEGTEISPDGDSDSGEIYGETIYHPNLGMIYLEVHDNPKSLSAKKWYIDHKTDYDQQKVFEKGEKFLLDDSVFIVSYPPDCGWSGLMFTFISHGNKIYKFQGDLSWDQYAKNDPGTTLLLSSLIFTDGEGTVGPFDIPKDWLEFPEPKTPLICPSTPEE